MDSSDFAKRAEKLKEDYDRNQLPFASVYLPIQNIANKLMSQTKPCCGNKGFSRYDYPNSQWVCSECGAIESNDPNYVNNLNAFEDPSYPWFTHKVVHPPEPKKCVCHINDLMVGGCTCGGK